MPEKTPPRIPDRLEKRLRPSRLRPELEPLARELVEKSHTGSKAIWDDLSKERLEQDVDLRRKFYSLAHDGMFAAQEQMVDRIQSGEPLNNSEEVLFRGIADSIAWQMINGQLCYARRLFKSKQPPSFTDSSFESVVAAARIMREEDPSAMPLISDLTSMVQVGDLLVASPGKPLAMVEVKTGKENHRIGNMLAFYEQSGCERFREILTKNEPKRVVQQFERMRRQSSRMGFFGDLVRTGRASDPDTGLQVSIPEPTIIMESWDEALIELIESARKRGWAYDVQGSMHLGCYVEGPMLAGGHFAFLVSLDAAGDVESDFHIARLIDAMSIPLAPPLFNRPLPGDTVFDLLFGRMQVCIAVNIPRLILDCEMAGMNARVATKKEMAEARQVGGDPVLLNGKGVYVELDGQGMLVLDGIIFRALFLGERPESVIRGYLQNEETLTGMAKDQP